MNLCEKEQEAFSPKSQLMPAPIHVRQRGIPGRDSLPKAGETSGSRAIVDCLIAQGVEAMFGYPGGAIMPFYDALYEAQDEIKHILTRHEQGATHAAEGYAAVTGKVGVCIATSGPGATNLVTGIADAMMDSIPLVCITGQVVSSLLGSDAFQETDVIGITIPITKWNYQVTKPEEIPYIITKAFFLAQTGRPGPVVIDITKDAQIGTFDWKNIDFHLPQYPYGQHIIDQNSIREAADVINNSKKPLMLVGHGVEIAHAEQEVQELSERAEIPVASTLMGLSSFATDHPNYVGMLGMHGNYGPNILTNEADLIIAVGMRFDDRVTGDLTQYATQARVIHFEIDQAEIGKNVRPDVAVLGDAKDGLMSLLPFIKKAKHSEWLQKFYEADKIEEDKVIGEATHPSSPGLKMSEVVSTISDMTRGEAVIVSDVGQHQMMSARYYKFKYPRSYFTSGGLGTMGFSVPASMGVALGCPDRTVISFVGDGSFQMTIQELGTIAQENYPLKVVILNNNFLGMVRQWQELFFDKRYSSTPITSPNYQKLCEAYGITSELLTERKDLQAAIGRMLDSKGPFFLEVAVEKEENVFPMVPAGASVSEIRLD